MNTKPTRASVCPTMLDYTTFTSKTFGATQGILLVKASVSKFLMYRKWEIRLAVIDALNRNSGINRTANANYVQQEAVRSLGRYGLLTAIYSFNKGGKKVKKRDAFDGNDE